ncbi:DEAD/DEAH box helicase family protein [Arcobacter sp. KX21116]|uniref:DEAD/DEAH box helicase family protein n=1 Tax=Arcobacter iocasae TaxID=2906515 RepID=UPI0035D4ACFE
MNELHLQDKFLIPFFTTNHGMGLGYKEVQPNTVTSNLLIESDLIEFLKTSEVNKTNFKKLEKKFKSEKELTDSLIEFIEDKIKDFRNMALFLNNSGTITFEGLKFYLFNRSESEIKGDADFDENIFSVVQELRYKYHFEKKLIYSFRPDITLFVNGIFLGYCELKSNWNNQNSKKKGRLKVIKDYKEAVISYLENIENNSHLTETQRFDIRKDMLKVFEKAIWISTTDINETYIIRDITKFFDEVKAHYDEGKYDYEQYNQKVEKNFKQYPLITTSEEKQDKLAEVFKAHYSKKMIEKEILYYNFIEREIEQDKKGNKILKNQRGNLISPRPKQKFGVDKIMSKIDEFLEHENESDYFINKLKDELKHLPQSMQEELINKRLAFHNNKNIYSLLLQYAAGFGKSNIIGWSALQLKDLKKDASYVYDKIMLIVDRVQLRDQLDTKMFNMNIDNKMYVEASDKTSFQKALREDTRLVIVNLQKFNDLRNIMDSDTLKKLSNLRVAFLIDEIHRSNSGSQSEEMLSVFDELQNSFDTDEAYASNNHKKNLIIGFTATPSHHTLARFGEFNKYAEAEKLWVPFDSYTMKEAILDGYILNPLSGIVAMAAKMYFELPDNVLEGLEDADVEKQYSIKKKRIYENEERIDAISKHIAKNLVQVVYRQIRGTGKAMLATASIKAAKKYKERVEYHFNQIVQDKKYKSYNETPIYIVYSAPQNESSASTLNGGLTEEKVLQNFALSKNGLIIVVDKLQTGFDEPKLHTLYLDKEIRGINAIQTISRVNRTTKYKNDCKIIDFSYKNVNVNNLKEAFEHFSDVVVSDFDPLGEVKALDVLYKDLRASNIYKEYFVYFSKISNDNESDPNLYMNLENSLIAYIKANPDKSKELKLKVNHYFKILNLIEFVIDFDKKYLEYYLLEFYKRYSSIYNSVNKTDEEKDEVEIYYDNRMGIVENVKEKPIKPNTPPTGGKGKGNDSVGYKYNILDIIEKRNEEEEEIGKLIEEFQEKIEIFFDHIKAHKDFKELKAKMFATQFGEDEVYSDFRKIYNSFVRRKKKEVGEFFIKETKDLVEKLCDDFEEMLRKEEI